MPQMAQQTRINSWIAFLKWYDLSFQFHIFPFWLRSRDLRCPQSYEYCMNTHYKNSSNKAWNPNTNSHVFKCEQLCIPLSCKLLSVKVGQHKQATHLGLPSKCCFLTFRDTNPWSLFHLTNARFVNYSTLSLPQGRESSAVSSLRAKLYISC